MITDISIINLAADRNRYEKLKEEIPQDGFNITRIEAVAGSHLPDIATVSLTKNAWSPNHKGTLGCFLSHAKAWELVLLSQKPALVLEDDAAILDPNLLGTIAMPADLDILFVNERTSYPGEQGLRPIAPVLSFVDGHRAAAGTDGYVISPEGANKCLSYIQSDTFFSHVDLRLVAYCLSQEEADLALSLNKDSQYLRNIQALRATYPAEHRLRGASLFPPRIGHSHLGSRRDDHDRAGRHQAD